MKKIILTFIILITISSCNIEKRLYRPGYNVDWNHNSLSKKSVESTEETLVAPLEKEKVEKNIITLTESKSQDDILDQPNDLLNNSQEVVFAENQSSSFDESELTETNCDIILCKNGDEIESKVIEIGTNEIKYKKCSYQDGPTLIIKCSDVLMIKYPNGTKDMIKSQDNNKSNENQTTSGKSQLVAFILCFFLGALGIHRFYLGHIGIGILELLTGGFFGILWLIDLIRILTGGLKPRKGDYEDQL